MLFTIFLHYQTERNQNTNKTAARFHNQDKKDILYQTVEDNLH